MFLVNCRQFRPVKRIRQAQQLSRGAERAHLLVDFSILRNDQQASDDRGLMHIQATTTFHSSRIAPPLVDLFTPAFFECHHVPQPFTRDERRPFLCRAIYRGFSLGKTRRRVEECCPSRTRQFAHRRMNNRCRPVMSDH